MKRILRQILILSLLILSVLLTAVGCKKEDDHGANENDTDQIDEV